MQNNYYANICTYVTYQCIITIKHPFYEPVLPFTENLHILLFVLVLFCVSVTTFVQNVIFRFYLLMENDRGIKILFYFKSSYDLKSTTTMSNEQHRSNKYLIFRVSSCTTRIFNKSSCVTKTINLSYILITSVQTCVHSVTAFYRCPSLHFIS